ncbi:F-box domain protein [Rostrohypoxylon terebratum]|nr:F-box domain protein [Rostrohypoxylon terebratum]
MTPTNVTNLPNELILEIIQEALPESFENLALTCKTIYQLCTPFIENHNRLRHRFRTFTYLDDPPDSSPLSIRTAFEIIKRIAVEPMTAFYIEHVTLVDDSLMWSLRGKPPQVLPDVDRGGPIVELFTNSTYLKEAGLDWKEYYCSIGEDLGRPGLHRYSQRAAAFLLTLLPNLKTLSLPQLWNPCEKTEKLLGVIVRRARRSSCSWDKSTSLARVTKFNTSLDVGNPIGLDQLALPFLALPQVREFNAASSIDIIDSSVVLAYEDLYSGCRDTLKTVSFTNFFSCLPAFAYFLGRVPHFRKLAYSHSPKINDNKEWNISYLVTAVEHEAGDYLEELSISVNEVQVPIAPGKVSMHGFKNLKKLELPLEVAMCNITDAESRLGIPKNSLIDREQYWENEGLRVGDIVPATVCHLSIILSSGIDAKIFKVFFSNFAAMKDSHMPALREVRLVVKSDLKSDLYQEEYTRLAKETERVGVMLITTRAAKLTT